VDQRLWRICTTPLHVSHRENSLGVAWRAMLPPHTPARDYLDPSTWHDSRAKQSLRAGARSSPLSRQIAGSWSPAVSQLCFWNGRGLWKNVPTSAGGYIVQGHSMENGRSSNAAAQCNLVSIITSARACAGACIAPLGCPRWYWHPSLAVILGVRVCQAAKARPTPTKKSQCQQCNLRAIPRSIGQQSCVPCLLPPALLRCSQLTTTLLDLHHLTARQPSPRASQCSVDVPVVAPSRFAIDNLPETTNSATRHCLNHSFDLSIRSSLPFDTFILHIFFHVFDHPFLDPRGPVDPNPSRVLPIYNTPCALSIKRPRRTTAHPFTTTL
jgi:hypothetical protein